MSWTWRGPVSFRQYLIVAPAWGVLLFVAVMLQTVYSQVAATLLLIAFLTWVLRAPILYFWREDKDKAGTP